MCGDLTQNTNLNYYIEDGKYVFTEEYHKQRGYCCGNGCRHCCYEPKHLKGNTTIKKE
jgi:hypothetical protein